MFKYNFTVVAEANFNCFMYTWVVKSITWAAFIQGLCVLYVMSSSQSN